jgi:hypothetical protein
VSPSAQEPQADPDLLIPIGLALLALREVMAAAGDAQLALQYLLFGLDVNDPQVTPALVEEGVPESAAPALETYVGRRLRPWLRQIDAGDRRATQWAEESLAGLAGAARGLPHARVWAERTLAAVEAEIDPRVRASWKHSVAERTYPGGEAVRYLAARGILQEAFGETVTG